MKVFDAYPKLTVYLAAFLFAFIAMTVARELVIPRMNWNAVAGHLAGDPQLYHKAAEWQKQNMEKMGIRVFQLRPDSSGPAGIASLSYYFFDSIYGVVFLNALLHATSVLLMFLLLCIFFSRKVALVSCSPILVSPYFMVWFSQINKDSYSIAGSLFILYGVTSLVQMAVRDASNFYRYSKLVVTVIFGILLIALVRPYLNQIYLLSVTLIFLGVIFIRKFRVYWGFVFSMLLLSLLMKTFSTGATSDEVLESFKYFSVTSPGGVVDNYQARPESEVANRCFRSISAEGWRDDVSLSFVNNKIKAILGHRCLIFTLLETQSNPTTLNSIVDTDIMPSSTFATLRYLPRAVVYGIFSPWPDRWFYVFNVRSSIFYVIAPVEAAILYIGLCFLIYWIVSGKRWMALVPVFFAIVVMSVYGLSTPFIGSLYRYRYTWWMLMISMGLGAIIHTSYIRYKKRKEQKWNE